MISDIGRVNLENRWRRFLAEEGGQSQLEELAQLPQGSEERLRAHHNITKQLSTNVEVGYPLSTFRAFVEEKANEVSPPER